MRRARWLILAAISLIVFAVGSSYYGRLARMAKEAPAPVEPLKAGIDAAARLWHFRKNDDKLKGPNGQPCPVVDVTAKSFAQVQQPASYQLEGVELSMFHHCGLTFDKVTSAKAAFDTSTGVLYSEGEVNITRGLVPNQPPGNRLVKMVSSGVYYETRTGKVYTDKPASFTFENASGTAVGADYDPNNHQLHMKNQVVLNWKGKTPDSEPMHVETGDLVYFEHDGKIALSPWARLDRGSLKAEGAKSLVTLEQDDIRLIETESAHGINDDGDRKVEYWADHITMQFNDGRQVEKVNGDGNAHMISTSDTGVTDVKSDRVELSLNATDKTSTLEKALALGHGIVESKPSAKAGPPPQSRILKSDAIELRMKPGGREIDNVETSAPGTLDFVPNAPTQPHRVLTGEKFWIVYGDSNQIQSFRAIKARTKTENPPKQGKPQPPVLTSSEEFKAEFDPKSNQLARIDQSANFRYEAGDRKAQADRAVLDQKTDLITLTGSARLDDPSGGAGADRIVMNQKTSDFTAEGHVTSTRLPDKKGAAPSAMLSNDEATQAKANKMVSKDNNRTIHYEGDVVAWQGANRIASDALDLDRDEETLHALGSVVSQFVDKPKKDKNGKPLPQQQTVYTIVKAPELFYTEDGKLAHYKGGAVMTRPNMTVKGREIRAYLKDAQSGSSIDRAFADGDVTILQTAPKRSRTGNSEHAEYFTGDEKIIMSGGDPRFVDSLKGTTRGKILTYFPGDDRLLVNGVETQRAESLLHRKK